MYKQYGLFYATNIYNCKGYENFHIRKDILYTINCYNLEEIPKFETYEKFIKSKLSNPIQELLMITGYLTTENSKKLISLQKDNEYVLDNDIMKDWFNKMKQYTEKKTIFSFLTNSFNSNAEIHVLTSINNLGIARSRTKAIDYIINNEKYFNDKGLTHVLMLDDSDFIGLINKDTNIDVNVLYRQCHFANKNIKDNSVGSAARCSYWQNLIPINRIENFKPLLADLAEDVIMLQSFKKYPDHFVDYSSYKSDNVGTNPLKMSLHFNPPILFKDDKKLVSYDTNGNKIDFTIEMLRTLLPKYSFICIKDKKADFIINSNINTIYSKLSKAYNENNIFDKNVDATIKFYSANTGSILDDDSLNLIMNYIEKDYKICVIVNNSIGTKNLQLYELKNISDKDVFKVNINYNVYLNNSIISKKFETIQLNFKYKQNSQITKCINYLTNPNIQPETIDVKFNINPTITNINTSSNEDFKIKGGKISSVNMIYIILFIIVLIAIIIIVICKNLKINEYFNNFNK